MKKQCAKAIAFDKHLLQKIIIMSKLCLLLFTCSVLTLNARTSYSQQVKLNLEMKNASLSDVINAIKNQTEFEFAYDSNLESLILRNVSIKARNEKIDDVLASILQGTDINYKVFDKIILLSKNALKITPGLESRMTLQQQRVTGTITDGTTREPIAGANIIVEGTTVGTTTDADGKYSLEVPGPKSVLLISFVGYINERVEVSNQTSINVTLVSDIKSLEEVVVVGYGTAKKADLTGAVSSVQSDNLMKVSGANASTALAGRMPGVMITQSSGAPGDGASIKIRGIGSLYSDNNPLVLIDGFQGDLDKIAASDIESVTVLKDAASAAIYGSRAANGVVLITTKRGKKEEPLTIQVGVRRGVQQATHLPGILKTQEWIQKSNLTGQGRGTGDYWITGDAKTDPSLQTTDFDWMGYLFRPAPVTDVNASMTGGTSTLRYSVSANYFDQDGIIIDESFKRASMRGNLDYVTDKLSIGASLSQYRTWNLSSIDREMGLREVFRTPTTIAAFNPDGTLSGPRVGYPGEAILDQTPAMRAAARDYNNRQNTTVVNLYGEVKLLKGLKFKTVFNSKSYDYFEQTFTNMWKSYAPDGTIGKSNALAKFENKDITSWLWESQNLLTYTLDLQSHHLGVLAGYSAQEEKYARFEARKSGYPKNGLYSLDAGQTNENISGTTADQNIMVSQFGRLNYSYKSKYLLEANIRRDGSANFGPGYRWGVFPSVSAGWRISEEEFMKNIPTITNLKLRGGYGTLGNQNTAGKSYLWMSSIDLASNLYVLNNTPVSGGVLSGPATTDLTWEKTTTTDFGMDLGLFKNKLALTAEIFNRTTSDMLLDFPVPASMGVNVNPWLNTGEVKNNGWEFVAEYNDHVGDLEYGLSFNISHIENEVTKLDNAIKYIDQGYNGKTYNRTQVGEAIRSFYGYQVEGIWQNQTEISNSGYTFLAGGSRPGDFKYKDIDGNDTIDAKDRTFLGSPYPKLYFGGNVFVKWKGFDLSMLLQGVYGRKLYVTPDYGMDLGGTNYPYMNVYKELYDNVWRQDGDQSKYPALGHTSNDDANSTWVQDASYLRIKNLELGYTLPKKFLTKAKIKEARIYVNVTNLATFTNFVGFDPEMEGVYSTGGVDYFGLSIGGANYPQARTFSLGLNLTF